MAEKPTYEELEKRIQELEQAEFKHKIAEKKRSERGSIGTDKPVD